MAYRFITIPVSINNILAVICGTEPPLKRLVDLADNVFRNEVTLMQKLEKFIPCGISECIELDSAVIAIIIVNTRSRKYVFSTNIHHRASNKGYIGDFSYKDQLKLLFCQTFSNLEFLEKKSYQNHRNNCVADQYWCSDSNKFYAEVDEDNNIFGSLFISSIPTHTMK